MPSFDIVSEVDNHELNNAVDQANREVSTRFDLKDSGAKYELQKDKVILTAPSDFQVKQMQDILQNKLSKRDIDIQSLKFSDIEASLHEARQTGTIVQGVDKENAKKLIKIIKESKLKVQTAIQGEQVRVTGKKRDDLQDVIAMLKEAKVELPLQFVNFRD